MKICAGSGDPACNVFATPVESLQAACFRAAFPVLLSSERGQRAGEGIRWLQNRE
jgi:hypothetical protein